MNTCDKSGKDYLIETGTVHMIYFKKFTMKSIKQLLGSNFKPLVDSDIAEMKQTQLIKSDVLKQDPTLTSKYFEVLNKNVKIPNDETTYWCLTHKLDDEIYKKKHHIIGFEGVITPSSRGVVHHMELFVCMSDPDDSMKTYNGPCKSENKPKGLEQCRKVIAAWAMGAAKFVYPDIAGAILGGKDYYKSPYLVLEIHYDNPNQRNDIVDSSGLRIYYQSKLRKYDAGIMEIGLEYNAKNSIPPRTNSFHLHGHCLGECTRYGLNKGPIYIFASQLHTHLTGRRVWTSQVRNNRVINIINSDNHYDQMFQEIRMLRRPVKVRPGDTLINTCVYETLDRVNMTVGGYSIRDEMCVNYMHYYPLSDLEVCKSSINDEILNRFFNKMNQIDYSETDTETKSVKENFNSIRWTPLTKSILSQLYDIAPITLSCNKSDGKHIDQVYNQNDNMLFKLNKIDGLKTDRAPIDYDLVGDCFQYSNDNYEDYEESGEEEEKLYD